MKKLNVMKTIQLIILVAFTALCVYLIFFREDMYFAIAQDPATQMVCFLLWFCLVCTYIFILMDFIFTARYKKSYQDLYDQVRSDPVSGLANRNSCDAVIDKYMGRPLPAHVGCIMFDITNIRQINEEYGHAEGNKLIRDFSNILKMAMLGLCFVGRNGGNKFLAIFEDCQTEKMDKFLERIDRKVTAYNLHSETKTIEYSYGVAFREGAEIDSITDLVALANARIYERG